MKEQKQVRVYQWHSLVSLYPRYEVYRGYIVFVFSVIMFVCLSVCLSVNFFFHQRFLLYPRYEVYRGYIVFVFSVIMFVCLSVCLSVNFFFSSKISQQLLGLGF